MEEAERKMMQGSYRKRISRAVHKGDNRVGRKPSLWISRGMIYGRNCGGQWDCDLWTGWSRCGWSEWCFLFVFTRQLRETPRVILWNVLCIKGSRGVWRLSDWVALCRFWLRWKRLILVKRSVSVRTVASSSLAQKAHLVYHSLRLWFCERKGPYIFDCIDFIQRKCNNEL